MKVNKDKFMIIRARKCMSVPDLRAAGLSQGNLNSIWNQKSMKPETVGKIAKALGVDVLDIVEGEVN